MLILHRIAQILRHPKAREVMWSVLATFGIGLIDRARKEGSGRRG